MSADKFSILHCLTTTGWLSIQEQQAPPEGWVRVYEEIVYQGSPYGRQSRHWQIQKANANWMDTDADAIERTFPRPQPQTELSFEAKKFLGL